MAQSFLIRHVRARPQLFACIVVGWLVAVLLPQAWVAQPVARALVGWDVGVCLYLSLAAHAMLRSTHETIRQRARQQDEGQLLILTLVTIGAIASITAIIVELSVAKNLHGGVRYLYIGQALFTIVVSWIFTHTMFALHYAHDYFVARMAGASGGINFPVDEKSGDANAARDEPRYGDFLYFSFIIGTSAQTADVSFTSKPMRRIGLVHCVLAFFFNTAILALTINIAASLF